jgi:hypothetical protein
MLMLKLRGSFASVRMKLERVDAARQPVCNDAVSTAEIAQPDK